MGLAWHGHALEDLARLNPGYDPWRESAGFTFDEEAGLRVLQFFETCLVHIEGKWAGKPLIPSLWQAAILVNLFAWKAPDGTRRYREALIAVARKNGKTTLAAGICLYMLFCDGEVGAQIYSCAAEKEQAALLYRHAAGMVAREPQLKQRARIYRSWKSIEYPAPGSVYKALTADALTKHGLSVHCAVMDELHAYKTRDLVDVMLTSTGARTQPLVVHITTSDYQRVSICNEKWDYARSVRDGKISDPAFLPVIYEADPGDPFDDIETWKKANPNLGVSVSEEYIRRECQRAKASPAYLNTFKRLSLNMRTGTNVAPFDPEDWNACALAKRLTVPELEIALRGRPCFGGLDLATRIDLAAFVLYFPPIKDDDPLGHAVIPYFWVPKDNAIAREQRDRVPYLTWADAHEITLTEGNEIDFGAILAEIVALKKVFRIQEIRFDPWNATHIVQELGAVGFEMTEMRQGFASMTAPTKELLALVKTHQLQHGAHPVLSWMAGNLMIDTDPAGNAKPSKSASTEKIDGMVALVMAIAGAMLRAPRKRSVYDSRGILEV